VGDPPPPPPPAREFTWHQHSSTAVPVCIHGSRFSFCAAFSLSVQLFFQPCLVCRMSLLPEPLHRPVGRLGHDVIRFLFLSLQQGAAGGTIWNLRSRIRLTHRMVWHLCVQPRISVLFCVRIAMQPPSCIASCKGAAVCYMHSTGGGCTAWISSAAAARDLSMLTGHSEVVLNVFCGLRCSGVREWRTPMPARPTRSDAANIVHTYNYKVAREIVSSWGRLNCVGHLYQTVTDSVRHLGVWFGKYCAAGLCGDDS